MFDKCIETRTKRVNLCQRHLNNNVHNLYDLSFHKVVNISTDNNCFIPDYINIRPVDRIIY